MTKGDERCTKRDMDMTEITKFAGEWRKMTKTFVLFDNVKYDSCKSVIQNGQINKQILIAKTITNFEML